MKKTTVLLVLLLMCLAGATTSYAQRHDYWNYGPHSRWNPSWDSRPNPDSGACFYTTAPFRGHRFCVRAGDRLAALPDGLKGNISSIQLFGNAEVRIFNGRDFTKGSRIVRRTVPDLRDLRFRGGHTWNNRIQSLIVR